MLRLIRFLSIIVPLSISFCITSCSTFDPPVTVPVYGHIDSIHFNVPGDSASKQGSASAKIPYAWVYLDDNPVGAFQMPCTFPMLASNGVHTVGIYPGIIPVGTNSPAGIYTFYKFYSITLNMQQGKTYNLNPTSEYNSWVQFPYKENFESASIGIINYYGNGNKSAASKTTMLATGNPKLVFEGKGSGMVVVNKAHNYYIGYTSPGHALINNGSTPVAVEFNYRATGVFTIGLFEQDTGTQVQPIIIYPTTKWNKMYYNLNSTISTFQYPPYRIYFTIGLDSIDGHTSDTLLLDNIKILD